MGRGIGSTAADERVRLLDMRVQTHAFLKVADQRDDRDLRKREPALGFGGDSPRAIHAPDACASYAPSCLQGFVRQRSVCLDACWAGRKHSRYHPRDGVYQALGISLAMIEIPKNSFQRISGIELDYFFKHVMNGDDWAIFLKLVTMLEAASKRAIGIKLGIDPDLEAVGKLEFFAALRLCREANLIPEDAFNFANRARLLRNDLVHSGAVLELTVETVVARTDGSKYLKGLDQFVRIEQESATDSSKSHRHALLFACVVFVGHLAHALFDERWLPEGIA